MKDPEGIALFVVAMVMIGALVFFLFLREVPGAAGGLARMSGMVFGYMGAMGENHGLWLAVIVLVALVVVLLLALLGTGVNLNNEKKMRQILEQRLARKKDRQRMRFEADVERTLGILGRQKKSLEQMTGLRSEVLDRRKEDIHA